MNLGNVSRLADRAWLCASGTVWGVVAFEASNGDPSVTFLGTNVGIAVWHSVACAVKIHPVAAGIATLAAPVVAVVMKLRK